MGFAKRVHEQELEQGWSYTDGDVCRRCVEDYALQAAIDASASRDQSCSFCGRSPAADLDVLLEAFVDGLSSEYGDANDEGVAYESREGGYQWHLTWDTWELVEEFADVLVGDGLIEAVRDSMHDQVWVERDFAAPRRDEALWASWERFCHAVQHETRYVFWLRSDPDEAGAGYAGEIPASWILDELGKLIISLDLLEELPAGRKFWRARTHRARSVNWSVKDLGTVPMAKANQANRMSPAGIPYFYGSDDAATATAEVSERAKNKWVTVAAFETSGPRTVVNLGNLPTPPSLFDAERRHQRRPLLFLQKFVRQLSEPARMTWEQLDYVPTQIVTEYIFRIFIEGEVVVGLRYPSALTGGTSVVLDISNEDCVDQRDTWNSGEHLRLGLVPGSMETRRTRRKSGRAST